MGFSSNWLELREPSDRAARDITLLQRAARMAGANPVILDLGSGTGSTFRAFENLLPKNSQWRLVDNDPELLELAGKAVGAKATQHLQDLNDLDLHTLEGVTLVTASALIDLVSKQWLEKLASACSVPVYFALSYNGMMSWQPENLMDSTVTAAFNSHQRTDKGFGPALGPDSVEVATEIFRDHGFEVLVAESPWRLSSEQKELQKKLVSGITEAVTEFGLENAKIWESERMRLVSQSTCQIGHGDILAIPHEKNEWS